jgi:AraC-like DNA-binding protein
MDQLTALIEQTHLTARVFFSGEVCEIVNFDDSESAGHLHLVKSGQLSVSVKQKELAIIQKPSVLFFPRPCAHTIKPITEEPCDLLCASIDLGLKVRSPLAMTLPEASIISLEDMTGTGQTLDLLFQEAFSQHFGRQSAVNRLTEYFIIQMFRHLISVGKLKGGILAALSDSRLAKAVHAMHERPDFPWTLQTLADEARMSRARFAVNFRMKVGMTPIQYLADWRLSITQKLLLEGVPVSNVAAMVGYSNQTALSRAFLKKFDCSPREWLRMNM